MNSPITTHPRIFLTPDVLTTLKTVSQTSEPRWQRLINVVNANLTTPSWDIGIPGYALCYKITSNAAYATAAITLMSQTAVAGAAAVSGDVGYYTRSTLPAMAIGYDWCYDQLTPAQKTQMILGMEQMTDWVWPETNPSRVNGWSISDPGNNYYQGFMMTWMIGLALYGDSAKASGYISNAYQKWHNVVKPYLATTGAGGYWAEGTNYGTGSSFRVFQYLNAHLTATGENLYLESGFTWPKECLLSNIHMTVPTMDLVYPGGDQARVSNAPLSDYSRSIALHGYDKADLPLNYTNAQYMKWWLDHISPNQDVWSFTAWEEFLRYPYNLTGVDYTQSLPTTYLSPGVGLCISRSDWSVDATQVCFCCGSYSQSHQERATGMFCIYRSDWQVALAKVASHSGLLQEAQHNNAPVLGHRTQFLGTNYLQDNAPAIAAIQPQLLQVQNTPQYTYFSGNIQPAYNYWNTTTFKADNPVSSFLRHLIHIKPNYVILLDVFTASATNVDKILPLNFITQPTINGNLFTSTVSKNKVFGQVITTSPYKLRLVNNNDSTWLSTYGDGGGWRVDTFIASGTTSPEYVLTVMELAPSGQASPTQTQVSFDPVKSLLTTNIAGNTLNINIVTSTIPVTGIQTSGSISTSGTVITSGSTSGVVVVVPATGTVSTSGYAALLVQYAALSGQYTILQQTNAALSGTVNGLLLSNNTLLASLQSSQNQLSVCQSSLTNCQGQLSVCQTQNVALSGSISNLLNINATLNSQLQTTQTSLANTQSQLLFFTDLVTRCKTALGIP